MELSREIRDFALDLGYNEVGITTADPFPIVAEALESRRDTYRWAIDGGLKLLDGATPTSVMPSAKSIIVVAYDYAREGFPTELVGKVGRAYQGRAYLTPTDRIHGARRALFRDFLESRGMEVMHARQLNVAERMAAARAGITTFGRNNFAYTNSAGSFIIITAFVVDRELEYDEPTIEAPCPDGCRLCIDACPTGALESFKLNPVRCIGYNCWITQDNYAPGASSFIPYDIREKMGSWIHGCDLCQQVCPRNQPKLKANPPIDPLLARIAERFDLRQILLLTDAYYESVVRPIMFNYIRDNKYFQRNAAIALGNSGDRSHTPYLVQALMDPEPLVRGYAAWALGRLGGEPARTAVEKALSRETDESAQREMQYALTGDARQRQD